MALASIDGQVGPVAEARISITDEGLLRGDGAFEVMRLYGGRAVRAARTTSPACATRARACGWRPTSTRCAAELDALLDAAGAGRRPAAHRPHPRRAADRDRRAAPAAAAGRRAWPRSRYAPGAHPRRAQDALLRRQHARRAARQGARLRRGAAGHAARPRARGPDVVVLLGRGRRALHAAARGPHPRLDHPRAAAGGVRGRASARARSTTCAPPRRRSSPRPCARSCRSRRSTTSSCRPRRAR